MSDSGTVGRKTVSHLIQDLEDGSITPRDRQTLMQLMRERPAVRELYLKHIELAALLHEAAGSRVELGTMPISIETLRREKRRSVIISLIYAAAAVVVVGVGLLLFRANSRPPTSQIAIEGSADASYALVRPEEATGPGDRLAPGDQINLTGGLLKLSFPSGVEALIEGPSQLELIAKSTLRMDQGIGWFRVPEKAKGFTVRTELGRVIDLGTEFGIRFDARGELEVHAADGRVKVVPSIPDAREVELVGGEAMEFDSKGGGKPLELRASLFRRQFTKAVPHVHWSFDTLIDGAFPARGTVDEVDDYALHPQYLDARPVSPDDHLTRGFYDRAFSLKGDGLFAESSFPGIDGNAPRTVAAWIRHRGGNAGEFARLDDPRTGLGATVPSGEQAYLLNYTNAGLTTTRGATGQVLTAGVTYSLGFHAARLSDSDTSEYRVELVAFDPSEDDASRVNSSVTGRPGTVVATAEGPVSANDPPTRGEVSFSPRADDPNLGKELGIRLMKASGPVLFDDIRLTTRRGATGGTIVFSEDFERPVIAGYAEQVLPASGWIGADRGPGSLFAGYGAKRHGLFSQRPAFAAPYFAWNSPTSGSSWAAFALPTTPARWSVTDGRVFHDSPRSGAIRRDQWTHVATVRTGRITDDDEPEILHFIDGEMVATEVADFGPAPQAGHAADSAARMHIGELPGARPGDPTLDADIDELHIFRAALGEEDIRRLMDGKSVVFSRD